MTCRSKMVLCGAGCLMKVGHMRHTSGIVMLVLAVAAASCTKNTSTAPTNTTTTTVATTTSTTTSVVTTSIPATFIVSGRVTAEGTGAALGFADIEILQGANIGRRFQGASDGTYTMPNLNPGTFVARYWAPGYLTKDVTITVTTSNQTVDVQLTPVPVTTTTVAALNASFTFSPNPCTISPGPAVNCTVDSSSSTGDITTRQWLYA